MANEKSKKAPTHSGDRGAAGGAAGLSDLFESIGREYLESKNIEHADDPLGVLRLGAERSIDALDQPVEHVRVDLLGEGVARRLGEQLGAHGQDALAAHLLALGDERRRQGVDVDSKELRHDVERLLALHLGLLLRRLRELDVAQVHAGGGRSYDLLDLARREVEHIERRSQLAVLLGVVGAVDLQTAADREDAKLAGVVQEVLLLVGWRHTGAQLVD